MKMLLISLSLIASQTVSDDAFTLMEKAVNQFVQTEELAFNFEIRSNCDATAGQSPTQKMRGSFRRKGKDFAFRQGTTLLVDAEGIRIHINDRDKVMIVQKGG